MRRHNLHRHITGRQTGDYMRHYTDPAASYPAEVAGNPFPLGAGLVSGIASKIGHAYDPKKHVQRQAMIRYLGEQAKKGAKTWEGKDALAELRAIARGEEGHNTAIYTDIVNYAQSVLSDVESTREEKKASAEEAAAAGERREERITGAATGIGTALASAFGRSRRPRRTTYDRYGRRRTQYEEEDVGGGGFQSAGLAGNLGGAGGGKLASQLGKGALVVGAGAAAYLATKYLTAAFARGVANKEEAGAAIAMANGQAIRELQRQTGKRPTQAQLREMKAAMSAKLVELGYDPVTLTRKRSAVERFFTGLEE